MLTATQAAALLTHREQIAQDIIVYSAAVVAVVIVLWHLWRGR